MNDPKEGLRKQLGVYFAELEAVQTHMLEAFRKQQLQLAAADAKELEDFAGRQASAVEPLQQLVQRREELLTQARSLGIPAQNLRELAAQLGESEHTTAGRLQQLHLKMLTLNHASHSLWIACQKSLLHYGRVVDLIANGGRRPIISSTGKHHNQGGAILDAFV